MPEDHLSSEQLTALRDGHLDDPEVARHLQDCRTCQGKLREALTLGILIRRPEGRPSRHPQPEELAAYADGTFGHPRLNRIQGHVARCPRCFTDLDALRRHARHQLPGEETTPAWLIAQAARTFRPPEQPLRLGTLIVRWRERAGFFFHLVPEPQVDTRLLSSALSPRHPASIAFSMSATKAEAALVADSVEPPHESEPAILTAGSLTLYMTGVKEADEVVLVIRVTRVSDNAPASGVVLTLETEQGPSQVATTGEDGQVRFPLPEGRSRLLIREPMQAELGIEF